VNGTVSPALEPILVVDDDDQVRELVRRVLESHGFTCETAASSGEARERIDGGRYALILCDVNMPGGSGLDLVRQVLADRHDLAAVMMTGQDDARLAEEALDLGAYGFVIKPFRQSELLINVTNALRRRRLELQSRAHRELLEETVRERTVELRSTIAQLERSELELRRSHQETIRRLSYAAEYRDEETGRHVERMSRYCLIVARGLGLGEERCRLIGAASPMHDVGKIGIPDRILLTPDPLTPEDWVVMRRHPEIGFRILAGSGSELLELAAVMALTHHERIDGSGYPDGLHGEEIPLEGRIAAVADVFDAVTNDRVYQRALPVDDAFEIIREGRGRLFDPDVVDCFLTFRLQVLAAGVQAEAVLRA
jgi:putative two-component system response regulator